MKCYIYFIINKVNNKRYVGQTTNYSRRRSEHLLKLREGKHPNIKLQNAWDKYGENKFVIEKITYENLTKEELDDMEKYYIQYYDSKNNGYNMTLGGTGGDTKSKLSFEQFCFAYFGNKKYDGLTNRTGKYLNVDSSCISSIKNNKSYDAFRQKALKLSTEEKEKYIKDFENKMCINKHKPWVKQKTLDEENTFNIMCVASTYGRGIESTILKHFSLSKGFIFYFITGKGRQEIKKRYKNTSKEERINIGKKYFQEWELQKYSRNKIKEEYKDLFVHYDIADLK